MARRSGFPCRKRADQPINAEGLSSEWRDMSDDVLFLPQLHRADRDFSA
jgi:hypothetical protein